MTRRTSIIAAALVLAVAGCGQDSEPAADPSPTPAPITVRGQLTLELPNFVWNPGVCAGREAFDDLTEGASVVVTDNATVTVGMGKLGPGEPALNPDDPGRAKSCTFPFTVNDVPAGKGFYGIEVAGHGRVQFTESQLASPVEVELT